MNPCRLSPRSTVGGWLPCRFWVWPPAWCCISVERATAGRPRPAILAFRTGPSFTLLKKNIQEWNQYTMKVHPEPLTTRFFFHRPPWLGCVRILGMNKWKYYRVLRPNTTYLQSQQVLPLSPHLSTHPPLNPHLSLQWIALADTRTEFFLGAAAEFLNLPLSLYIA